MKEIYFIDEIMTDFFVPGLISAIKNSGYEMIYGGMNGELDIIVYNSKKKEIGNIQIQRRDFHCIIYLQTRSKKIKNLLTDTLNKL